MDRAIDNPSAGFTVVVEPDDVLVITYRPTGTGRGRIAVATFLGVWFAMCLLLTMAGLFAPSSDFADRPGLLLLIMLPFWLFGALVYLVYASIACGFWSYRIDPNGLEFDRRFLFIRRHRIIPWSYVKEIRRTTYIYENVASPPSSILRLECDQRYVGRPPASRGRPPVFWYSKRIALLYAQPEKSDWLGNVLAACSGIPYVSDEEKVASEGGS